MNTIELYHMSTIMTHHLGGLFRPNIMTSWLLISFGRALHRFRRGHGFKSRTGLNNFFQVLFSTSSSVVFIATRISYIRFFTAVHIYDLHISTILTFPNMFSDIRKEINLGADKYLLFTMNESFIQHRT